MILYSIILNYHSLQAYTIRRITKKAHGKSPRAFYFILSYEKTVPYYETFRQSLYLRNILHGEADSSHLVFT